MQTSINSRKIDLKESQLTSNFQLNTSKIIGADSIPKVNVNFSTAPTTLNTEQTIRPVEEFDLENFEEVPREIPKGYKYSWLERTKATMAVSTVSILDGFIDAADGLVDGLFHAGANVCELLGNKEGAEATRKFIAENWGDNLNEYLFNSETGIAKEAADASYIAYDGKVSKWLRNTSNSIAEITAATMCGGVPSTLFYGFLSGSGKAAEKKYQKTDENGNYEFNLLDEALINVSGVLGSLSWVANRALGKGVKDLASVIKQNKSILPTLTEAYHDIFNLKFVKNAFAKQLKGLTGVTTVLNTGFEVAPDIMKIITGEEENNLGNWLKVGTKGAWYLLSLAMLSELKSYIKNPYAYKKFYDGENRTKALTDQLEKLKVGNTKDLMKFKPEQQKMLIDEILLNSKNPDIELFRIFKNLSNEDADKLLKNVSGVSGRQEQIVKLLASGVMQYGEDESLLEDINKMGTNFQKYIINNLPLEEQKKLAAELSRLYQSGKMSPGKLRDIIDPDQEECKKFLDMISSNFDDDSRTNFITELFKADRIRELSKEINKVVDNIVKPVSETMAKTATSETKVKTIREAWNNITNFISGDSRISKSAKVSLSGTYKSLTNIVIPPTKT